MEEQAQFLEGNPDSQVKNAETNITENKKIELNTIHGKSVHPRIWKTLVKFQAFYCQAGIKPCTYQNQLMI